MPCFPPQFQFRVPSLSPCPNAFFGGLAIVVAVLTSPLVSAQTAAKDDERLTAEPEAPDHTAIATAESDAWREITAPLAPTRLSLVLAPSAIDLGETVFIDVYLQPAGEATNDPDSQNTATDRLTDADRSRLAGTVAFTEAKAVGEEEYFVVNVPPGMRFPSGAAIVTLSLTGANSPLRRSAVALRQATLLK